MTNPIGQLSPPLERPLAETLSWMPRPAVKPHSALICPLHAGHRPNLDNEDEAKRHMDGDTDV